MNMTATPDFRTALLAILLTLLAMSPSAAQSSASYKLEEATVNSGGVPENGAAGTSAHYHLSFAAIGDGAVRTGLTNVSFKVDGGFVSSYAPPGEVTGLRFTNATTLQWNPDPSADRYEVYRDLTSSLPGTFGSCFASDLPMPATTDASIPATGSVYFYLATSRNRLLEEGTKGFRSNGTERGNPLPCP